MAYGLTQSMRLTRASSQYATIADNASLSITGDITIEFWIKLKSQIATNGNWELICKSTAGATNRGYELDYNDVAGTKQLRFLIFPTGGVTNFYYNTINKALTVDTWEHIAMVCDVSVTNKVEWFYNGVSAGNGTNNVVGSGATSIFDSTAAFRIGQSDPVTAGLYADAQFSLVRVWNDLRTSGEISANLCNVFGTAEAGMAAEWTLDNVYTDNSGNGNTLSGVNTPTFITDTPSTCGAVTSVYNSLTMMGIGS